MMTELKSQIIDMVNSLDNERWTKLIYYYVKHIILSDNRKSDVK